MRQERLWLFAIFPLRFKTNSLVLQVTKLLKIWIHLNQNVLSQFNCEFLFICRAIEVCQQLDLKSGYHYHEKLIGGQLQINEDERAM